jgi:hypothetical protein
MHVFPIKYGYAISHQEIMRIEKQGRGLKSKERISCSYSINNVSKVAWFHPMERTVANGS